jgi:hypothetical protein
VKTKDLMLLVVAAIIFIVCGYVAYTQLTPKKSAAAAVVQVPVVGSIPAQMDAGGMSWINDTSKVQDYDTPINISSGLNNTAPFGQ